MHGIYELHDQEREHGERSWQLYGREDNGQLVLVDSFLATPFEGAYEVSKWLCRCLIRDGVTVRV